MKNIFSIFAFLASFFFLSNSSKGQTSTFFEGEYKPVVIWVYPPEVQMDVYEKVSKLGERNRQKYHFFLIPDSFNSKTLISKQINDYLNKEPNVDLEKVYFLEWGNSEQSKYFVNTNNDILADLYYYQIQENASNFNLDDVLRQFDGNRIWHIKLSEIEEKSLVLNPQLKKISYGLTWSRGSQSTFKEDSAYLPPSIGTFGLTVGYRINPRLYIFGRGQFSLNIPDMTNSQSTIFSQIDISKGGKQTVAIEMQAHVFLHGSLQANYFLTNSKKFQPFVGAGISFINFRSAKIRRETEIDVDKLFSGGGIPSAGGAGGLADGDLSFFIGSTIQPFISLGLSYKLIKNVRLMAWGEYSYTGKDELKGIKFTNNNHSNLLINYGIQFEFNKKQNKYYQYFK
jgi:hypothetical protein